MARVVYGVWDGIVQDNRGKRLFEMAEAPDLKGLDTFNEGNPIQAFFGDRGFFVFDRRVSLIDALWRYMARAAEESCGKCTPCRMGTALIRDALEALRKGEAGEERWAEIEALGEQLRASALCGLGRNSASALMAALTHFRDVLLAERGPLPEQHGMTYTTAPCIEACPSKVNVPRYIDYIKDGEPTHSLGVILQKYPMAATCGRVCVRFCEMACRRNLVDEAVGIKTLKRFIADHQRSRSTMFTRDVIAAAQPSDLRVAVVGAGPAGVSCAYHLLLKGYPVDVLEALDEAGGMAATGIPAYRLPKDVLKSETDIIQALGGRFLYGRRLGRDFTVSDLFAEGYKAAFLAVGCAQGSRLGVEDEDPSLPGYLSGIDFLLMVHDHVAGTRPTRLSGEVVVVGGGNVAMDCVRSALRMGASAVHLVYRRTREDMPADREEIKAAEEEGVIFHYLTNPARIVARDGRLAGVVLVDMRQTEPDGRGRRGVQPVAGSERVFECSTLIAAIGQQVDRGTIGPEDGIAMDKWGCIAVDPTTLATSRGGVFAGGDCASGPSTLIHAMANGLKAARSIDDYLNFGRVRFFPRSRMRQILNENKMLAADCVEVPTMHEYRVHHPELDPEVRKQMFEEVEQTITAAEAYREANRCLRCYRVYSVITEQPIPAGCA